MLSVLGCLPLMDGGTLGQQVPEKCHGRKPRPLLRLGHSGLLQRKILLAAGKGDTAMRQSDAGPNGRQKRLTGPRISHALSQLPTAVLAAGLTVGSLTQEAHAAGEIPFSEVRIILETNDTDCDVGLQIFFDAEAWRRVTVEKPNGTPILEVAAKGSLFGFGLTEQFNETSEPVMEELVEAFPELECEEPEFSLDEFFWLFPKGIYEFEGRTIEGKELEGKARLSHVIPAAAEILGPSDDVRQDPNNTVIK
jgi:hypothetical protein